MFVAEQHMFSRALRAEPNRVVMPEASGGFDAASSRRRRCHFSHPEVLLVAIRVGTNLSHSCQSVPTGGSPPTAALSRSPVNRRYTSPR